ncbi:hypothetical protein D3C86_1613600 [compost metagenome]
MHLAHALGVGRQALGQLLGLRGLRLATQGHHAIFRAHLDVQALGVAVPQQLGLHRGGQGDVVDALGQARLVATSGLDLRVDLQLVVDLLHPFDAQGDLFGQVALDLALDTAADPRRAVCHVDIDGEGVEVAVEGERRPDRAFLARLAQLAAQVAFGGMHGQGRQAEQADGSDGQGQGFQLLHGMHGGTSYRYPYPAACSGG